MKLLMTVKFSNFKEPTLIKNVVVKSVSCSGIYNDILTTLSPELTLSDDILNFLNNYDFNFDEPYRYVIKNTIYNIPTQSVNLVKFAINRESPYVESYNLKIDNPEIQLEQVESSFSVAGVYLDDTVLQRIFDYVPNDMPDYDPNPEESNGINGSEEGI